MLLYRKRWKEDDNHGQNKKIENECDIKRYDKRESCKGGRAYLSCICYGGERCNTGSTINAGNMAVFARPCS